MRDFIVTHAYDGALRFMPRVVRAASPEEAMRATVKDLGWTDRRITRSRFAEDNRNRSLHGRWYCDRLNERYGGWRDTLDVDPYYPSSWKRIEMVRLNRDGQYVKRLNIDEGMSA
jgi:hypothetical protein